MRELLVLTRGYVLVAAHDPGVVAAVPVAVRIVAAGAAAEPVRRVAQHQICGHVELREQVGCRGQAQLELARFRAGDDQQQAGRLMRGSLDGPGGATDPVRPPGAAQAGQGAADAVLPAVVADMAGYRVVSAVTSGDGPLLAQVI